MSVVEQRRGMGRLGAYDLVFQAELPHQLQGPGFAEPAWTWKLLASACKTLTGKRKARRASLATSRNSSLSLSSSVGLP